MAVSREVASYQGQQEIVDAINGFTLSGVAQKAVWFDSVSSMQRADIPAGATAATRGYTTVNDGGNAFYYIREKTQSDVEDGGSIIFLDNENVAELITNGTVSVKQFGAKGDATYKDLSTGTCYANISLDNAQEAKYYDNVTTHKWYASAVFTTEGTYYNDADDTHYALYDSDTQTYSDEAPYYDNVANKWYVTATYSDVANVCIENTYYYGAVFSTVATDDTDAIQKALDFSDNVVFPKASYMVVNGVKVLHDCTIYGNGATIILDFANSTVLRDVITARDNTFTIYNLRVDANAYGQTQQGNCIVLVNSTFYGDNIYATSAPHHIININGGFCSITNSILHNCGKANNRAFVYAYNDAHTKWNNILAYNDEFTLDNVQQCYYLASGVHEINNLEARNLEIPFDARNGSLIINNGYFYNTGGIVCQTSGANEGAEVIATNLIYDEVFCCNNNIGCLINITCEKSLVLQNIKMIINKKQQKLYPNYISFVAKFRSSVNNVMGKIRIENWDLIGDNFATNCLFAQNLYADTEIKLINCNMPTLSNPYAFLVFCYDTIQNHFYFENFKLKTVYDDRLVSMYNQTSATRIDNYTYIADVPQRGTTAERPILPKVCNALYYDTDLSKLMCWNGTSWVELT